MEFTTDKNGVIADDDKLYEQLDKWHDDDEYEKIIEALSEIPREKLSVKARFRFISAYNNLKKFRESLRELAEIEPLCKTPAETAKYWYMIGYIHYVNDHELLARHCFKNGLKADPDDTAELELKEQIEECDQYIGQDLSRLGSFAGSASETIKKRCAENTDKSAAADDVFLLYLGFLPAVRKIPGFEHSIGFGNFFAVYEGEERERVRKFLADMFGITDRESFSNLYHNNMNYNLCRMARDAIGAIDGTPTFDLNNLNEDGRSLFDDAVLFVGKFREYLPAANVLAWDISEKIGFARLCFSCGILEEDDYRGCMSALYSAAVENFSSFEEYLTSLIFGCGMFVFMDDNRSIKSAVEFMESVLPMLTGSVLPDIAWAKKPD